MSRREQETLLHLGQTIYMQDKHKQIEQESLYMSQFANLNFSHLSSFKFSESESE